MTKTRRSFTDEFKREAIKLVKQPGAKVSRIARDLGIDQSILRLVGAGAWWCSHMRPSRPIRSETTSEGERLQRDLRRVTMGGDLLKKRACVQSVKATHELPVYRLG